MGQIISFYFMFVISARPACRIDYMKNKNKRQLHNNPGQARNAYKATLKHAMIGDVVSIWK